LIIEKAKMHNCIMKVSLSKQSLLSTNATAKTIYGLLLESSGSRDLEEGAYGNPPVKGFQCRRQFLVLCKTG
jgi:hypothetical protein